MAAPIEPMKVSLMTPAEVAAVLRVSEKTLKNWRSLRYGPPFIKIGGSVRYRRQSIERWLNQIPEARRQRRTKPA